MKGLVRWFCSNSVSANLLMGLLLIGGLASLKFDIRREAFPTIPPSIITVSVAYPGATPSEVEESIVLKIEDAVDGVEDIDRISSTADENVGIVQIEIEDGANIREVLDDVKTEIDSIATFPEEAEEPTISQQKIEERVILVTLSGDASEWEMRTLTDEIRDELLSLDQITKVDRVNLAPKEISIEIDETTLRRYSLSLSDVGNAVRGSSLNLPAGSVRTKGGEIILRSNEQAYSPIEFERIPIRTLENGQQIFVEDVAMVRFGFEETDQISWFDGKRAMSLYVFRVGQQSSPDISRIVREYVEEKAHSLPESMQLTAWADTSVDLSERLELLRKNGAGGLALVVLVLTLFLRIRLAIWVAIGLATALAGALWLLPLAGQSLNFLSSFGLILVLGILVDDAIVVAENIDSHQRMGKKPLRAAMDGTIEVLVPVSLAVVTTGIAFSPMLRLPDQTGAFTTAIAVTVILSIFFSLVESLFILPSHLAHAPRAGEPRGLIAKTIHVVGYAIRVTIGRVVLFMETKSSQFLTWLIEKTYEPSLRWVIRHRALTLAMGIALLIVTGAYLGNGYMKFRFLPKVDGYLVTSTLTLPEGTSPEATQRAVKILEDEIYAVREEIEGDEPGSVFKHVATRIGSQPGTEAAKPPAAQGLAQSRANIAEVFVQLVPVSMREVRAEDVAVAWRKRVGNRIPEALELSFVFDQVNAQAPINVELSSSNIRELRSAAADLEERLSSYSGTFAIQNDYRQGKDELQIEVTPSGRALGLTQQQVAQQVRFAFYGDEAQRVQLGQDEVKVFVRYPLDDRRSLDDLDEFRVRLPDGAEVPFADVATFDRAAGPATIRRIDRKRTIVVTSDVDSASGNANEISADLVATFFPELSRKYPSLEVGFGGQQKRQSESFSGLASGMILALFLMYALLAIVFKSYFQPLIVLLVIPFGFAGAIWAHVALGMELSFLSMIGLLALMGVVVNDSLVLIDFTNRYRREHGKDLVEAILAAGPRRFRPIMLTSLTTFAGLTPILLEKSVQAAFVIPMVVSLAFGVAFATFFVLLYLPAAYLALEATLIWLTGEGDIHDEEEEDEKEAATEDVVGRLV